MSLELPQILSLELLQILSLELPQILSLEPSGRRSECRPPQSRPSRPQGRHWKSTATPSVKFEVVPGFESRNQHCQFQVSPACTT